MHPALFELGPIVVRYYGLMYVVALLVGVWLIRKESDRLGLGLSKDEVANYCLYGLIAGIVGGRIYYVIFNWSYYGQYPLQIPAIWNGGLAIHGGVIAGVLYTLRHSRRRAIPIWRLGDAVAPALVLGQAFGRFGNFMNGDAHGVPTALPWGIVFPAASIAGRQFPGQPLHPAMLYELLLNLCWFAVLWAVRKRPHRDGMVFALYVILYSAGRFIVSAFRADSLMIGDLRTAQVISVLLIAVGAAWIVRGRLWSGRGITPE